MLNRWISKLSWERFIETYHLAYGELWPLVLLWIELLPMAIQALKTKAVLR